MPAGVTYQFAPAQVYLSSGGTAQSTLTLSSTASTPGGASPLVITGTLGSAQRTAAFSLGTQVTTFQVTSVTGSAIVHNTGQEVQVTQSVPAGNAPSYTTCDTADPDVTCRVISTTPGAVTMGITASKSAAHGTRVVRVNGGAGKAHALIADGVDLDPLNVSISPSLIYSKPAGGWTTVEITLTGVAQTTGFACEEDNYCSEDVEVVDGFDQPVYTWEADFSYDISGDNISGAFRPYSGDEGSYQVRVSWCFDEIYDPLEPGVTCIVGYAPFQVVAPPPPNPKILFNGNDVTGQTPTVDVGQQIVFTANPDTGTLASPPWTVEGAVTGGWSVTYTDPDSLTTGGPPSEASFNTGSPTFYWLAAGTNKVTLTVNDANGTPFSVSTTFAVVAPTYSIDPTNDVAGIVNGNLLQYGVNAPGVSFTASITPPQNFTTGGQQWVQLVPSSTTTFAKQVGGTPFEVCTSSGLDTRYPYTTNLRLIDSPAVGPVSGTVDMTIAESYDTYLMWKPGTTNAIFVSIAHITWGWTADAILNGQGAWVKNPSNPPTYAGPNQAATSNFPTTWSTNVRKQNCGAGN
jgi:hypothetical protein